MERTIFDIAELFPKDPKEGGQFFGILRAIGVSKTGSTPQTIVDTLTKNPDFLPMIACDENEEIPSKEIISGHLDVLLRHDIVIEAEDGTISYSNYGMTLLQNYDRRVGATD